MKNIKHIKTWVAVFPLDPVPVRFFECPIFEGRLVGFENTDLQFAPKKVFEEIAESLEPENSPIIAIADQLTIVKYLRGHETSLRADIKELTADRKRAEAKLEQATGRLANIYKILQ